MSAILQANPPVFRAMREKDLPEIMSIERHGYAYPWTEGIFRDCMRVGYYCSVLERDGVIQAYAVMSTAAGESHVLNLCVRPESQRQGFGQMMLRHLLEVAARLHSDVVLLEVRPSNRPAVHLYSKLGFNEIGVRKQYYPATHGREDALIMALQLDSQE